MSSKINSCTTVVGTGWVRDPEGCSSISKTLVEEGVRISSESHSPLIFVGGNGGNGLPEALRAKKYLEQISQTREDVKGVLERFYTDCENFDGNPSRTTVGNAENTAKIMYKLQAELGEMKRLDIVAARIHIPRVIALYKKAFQDFGLGHVNLTQNPVDIEYEPENEQWFWRNESYRQIVEVANNLAYLVTGVADRRLVLKALLKKSS